MKISELVPVSSTVIPLALYDGNGGGHFDEKSTIREDNLFTGEWKNIIFVYIPEKNYGNTIPFNHLEINLITQVRKS